MGGALMLFGGLGFGCVVFLWFAVPVMIHFIFPSVYEEQLQAWLKSLTPAQRAAYWHHEKRKKQWVRLRRRQHYACVRIQKRAIRETGAALPWLRAWGEAAEQVGINAYRDVWAADDCPQTQWNGLWGFVDPALAVPPRKPAEPAGKWD